MLSPLCTVRGMPLAAARLGGTSLLNLWLVSWIPFLRFLCGGPRLCVLRSASDDEHVGIVPRG